jgi:uncharacterized surface protein with fasciclin (FAS1) repeats
MKIMRRLITKDTARWVSRFTQSALVAAILPLVGIGALSAQEADNQMNIVEVAVEAGDFTTLAAALQAAGLTDVLKGAGPFTVFAPTDAAFAKLPEGTVQALLSDKDALTAILTYHLVGGAVPASAVVGLSEATTLNGATVRIAVMDGKVMLNDANVTATDIMASNGIIHVIDSVLLPPSN